MLPSRGQRPAKTTFALRKNTEYGIYIVGGAKHADSTILPETFRPKFYNCSVRGLPILSRLFSREPRIYKRVCPSVHPKREFSAGSN